MSSRSLGLSILLPFHSGELSLWSQVADAILSMVLAVPWQETTGKDRSLSFHQEGNTFPEITMYSLPFPSPWP